jgi:hypothetical protein
MPRLGVTILVAVSLTPSLCPISGALEIQRIQNKSDEPSLPLTSDIEFPTAVQNAPIH